MKINKMEDEAIIKQGPSIPFLVGCAIVAAFIGFVGLQAFSRLLMFVLKLFGKFWWVVVIVIIAGIILKRRKRR